MEHIIIENVGPVREVDIDLGRINVFIGPQGSGKSTIAKIVSFCQWVEKDCVRRQGTGHTDKAYVDDQLVKYHNIEGYLCKGSRFAYSSDILDLEYSEGELRVQNKGGVYAAGVSKNAYLPAERNIISVPGIFSTKMPFSYLTDFIDDWQRVRDKYRNGEKVELLDLGQYYTYDLYRNKDIVINGDREFELSHVSSGLQSVTPLCVMVDYLTGWIYSHEEDRSAEERRALREAALIRLMANKEGLSHVRETIESSQDLKESFSSLLESTRNILDAVNSDIEDSNTKEIRSNIETLARPAMSNIVIEEPELNLFPTTQVSLVYYLLSKMNHTRDRMLVTTHSPYILYALNNCMLAYLASEEDAEMVKEVSEIPSAAFTSPGEVSVWELRDGGIRNNSTIQDARGLIRDNYFDRVMKEVMVEFRNLLNFV